VPASPVVAAEWRWVKGISSRAAISVSEEQTAEASESSQSLLGLSGFVGLDRLGRRSRLSLRANLEALRTQDDFDEEKDGDVNVRKGLGLTSRTHVIERFAIFDTSARISRRSLDGTILADGDTFVDESSENEIREISFGPTISSHISDFVQYQANYKFSSIRSSNDALEGSDNHAFGTRIVVAQRANGPYFFVGGYFNQAQFENNDSAREGLAGLGVAYRFKPAIVGALIVAHDWVRLSEDAEQIESDAWNANLRWRPNSRIVASVGYGERTFGRKPQASLLLLGRRSSVQFDWSRESSLSSRGSDQLSSLTFDQEIDGGQPTTVGDAPTPLDVADAEAEALAPFANEAFAVRERVSATYSLTGRVSVLKFSARYFSEQQPLEMSMDEVRDADWGELSFQFTRELSKQVDLGFTTTVGRGRFDADLERQTRVGGELKLRIEL